MRVAPVVRLAAIAVVALCATPSVARAASQPGSFPAAKLAERVESQLTHERASLKQNLSHYALVFPVEQSDLIAYLQPVRVFGEPGALVLGTRDGAEPHAGGLLAFLLDYWRPENRAADLHDRFRFGPDGTGVELEALWTSLQNQIFLPVPGLAPDAIHGALPASPQLARARFQIPGRPAVETDAYHFLGLLAAREPDLATTHTNALGQRLSAALLLEQARGYYLASRDWPAEPPDHSNLHLVEVLLAASRRSGGAPEVIQRHFLAVELQRRDFDAADATLVLGHYAESLGRLVADPRVQWSPPERAQARAWLRWLEETHFRDLAGEEPEALTHLLLGLRLIRDHWSRLAPAD